MRHASPLSLLLCLLAASTASAHDTVPKTWCPTGTQQVVIRQFSFTERQLVDYRNARPGYLEAITKIIDWDFVAANLDGEGVSRADQQG